MTIYYAADRTPPAARLVAFTERKARDGYVKADPDHREAVRAAVAAHLCRTWHFCDLSTALVKGLI